MLSIKKVNLSPLSRLAGNNMSNKKFWSEMTLDELVEHVTQHVHSELLIDGSKGMKRAIQSLLLDIACNKQKYELLKERK